MCPMNAPKSFPTGDRIKLAVIYGSVRSGRFCDTVARWVTEELADADAFRVGVIDPLAFDQKDASRVADLKAALKAADAFLVITPEYNHGYPAALKELIDSASKEWHAKPVAFVSYGGQSGGLRAVEQLRLVFAELHAVTIRDGVALPNAWNLFDADGRLIAPDAPREALHFTLGRLRWWAEALRSARAAEPYERSAA